VYEQHPLDRPPLSVSVVVPLKPLDPRVDGRIFFGLRVFRAESKGEKVRPCSRRMATVRMGEEGVLEDVVGQRVAAGARGRVGTSKRGFSFSGRRKRNDLR
jgi:hypothetical protein